MVHVLRSRRHDPNGPRAGDQRHQVEEVAALLDERATGVAIEAIPVVDLRQERKAMLADGDHLDRAGGTTPHLFDEASDWRLVTVFETHPHDAAAVLGGSNNSTALVDGGAQGLFDEGVKMVDGEHIQKDVGVGHVGRREHDCIAETGLQEFAMIRKDAKVTVANGRPGGSL